MRPAGQGGTQSTNGRSNGGGSSEGGGGGGGGGGRKALSPLFLMMGGERGKNGGAGRVRRPGRGSWATQGYQMTLIATVAEIGRQDGV
ncbi:hypothetical protein E2C01_048380 [Portunus trituberculatus]|uniref:Uncharacterized protein n=1 Tax=Portunus trituberculatus TaxID=210409 RepID=A0A5B7GB00_PORTR|nr:hypothetical protein [Portunus trituberculatus]